MEKYVWIDEKEGWDIFTLDGEYVGFKGLGIDWITSLDYAPDNIKNKYGFNETIAMIGKTIIK
jgi:hypothetical protein